MEHQFEAETLLDFPMYREFQRHYVYAGSLTTCIRIFAGLMLILSFSRMDNPAVSVGIFVFSAAYLLSQLVQNRKSGTTQYKRMLVSNDGKPHHARYCFLETGIQDTNRDTGNVYNYRYDQIRQLIDTPKLLLVVLQYRLCVIIEKEKVTGGTPRELTEFLLQQSPKIKRKKARSTTLGQWVSRVLNVLVVLGCIWGLLNFPGISLMDRMSGELTNSVSYREMAEELEPLGIHITERTLEELEVYDAEYLAMYGKEFYRDNPGASKVQDLLYWEGSGVTDPDTMVWTPSESGIYWIDLEVWNVASMYTDFLTGLDAMSAGISLDNIREVHRTVEADNGTVELSFELNGNGYTLDPWANLDWIDTEIVVQLGQILEDDQDPMDLYVAEDGGQGLYFFYGDEDTIRELSGLTGLKFCLASRLYSLY